MDPKEKFCGFDNIIFQLGFDELWHDSRATHLSKKYLFRRVYLCVIILHQVLLNLNEKEKGF